MAAIEDETKRIFAEHNYTIQGNPLEPIESPAPDTLTKKLPTFDEGKVQEAWTENSREMNHRGFTQEQTETASQTHFFANRRGGFGRRIETRSYNGRSYRT